MLELLTTLRKIAAKNSLNLSFGQEPKSSYSNGSFILINLFFKRSSLFGNGHLYNVSMLTNFVKFNVENDNFVSTLSNVVYINVEIHSVDSTL